MTIPLGVTFPWSISPTPWINPPKPLRKPKMEAFNLAALLLVGALLFSIAISLCLR